MHFPFLFLSLSSVFHLFPRQYHSLHFTLRRTKILFNVKLPNCKNARSFCLCRLYLLLVRLNRSFVSHIMIIIQQSPRNMKGEWNFRWVWSNKSLAVSSGAFSVLFALVSLFCPSSPISLFSRPVIAPVDPSIYHQHAFPTFTYTTAKGWERWTNRRIFAVENESCKK